MRIVIFLPIQGRNTTDMFISLVVQGEGFSIIDGLLKARRKACL